MKQAIFVKSLTIALTSEQYAQIKEITDERRISMGEWMREDVERALNDLNKESKMKE